MKTRSIALAGMISDTSLYNVDGACAVGGVAAIPAGTAVLVSTAEPVDGHKIVAATGITANTAYGVVVRSHYETPDGSARPLEAVNVLSAGRIWMRSDLEAAPAFGSAVSVTEAGIASSTGVATGWSYAGGFVAAAANPDGVALVEVQVKQK